MTNNPQEDYYKIIQLIENIVRNGNNVKISTEGYSYEFVLAALKSSLFINAGAFAALPAFKSINLDVSIFFPSILFVFGIIFSALSMFFTYRNLQHLSNYNYINENIRASRILLNYEKGIGVPYHQREMEIENYNGKIKFLEKKINRTFIYALIFGFTSYILFIIGFFYAGKNYFLSALCAN